MLFWEAFATRNRPVRLKILATDVHQASLEVAGAGGRNFELSASRMSSRRVMASR